MQLTKTNLVYKIIILSMSVGLSMSAMAMTYAQLEALSNQGDTYSQYLLGMMYDKGAAVDEDKATEYYKKGYGEYHYNKDYFKAFQWYEKSANLGHVDAQEMTGMMYDKGLGVRQDATKAVYWYEKSASQGDISAINSLGNMYYTGRGVSKDYEKAKKLYGYVCDAGDQVGCDNYRIVNTK